MDKSTPFGKLLREKRVAAGMSLREVADHIGVSHVYLSQVERGKTTPLTQDKWPKLLELLPSLDEDTLEYLSDVSRPVQLNLSDMPKEKQELGLLLARKLESMPKAEVSKMLEFLRSK